MRVGFSSYSFFQLTGSGQMTIPEVAEWVAASEADHLELATGFASDNPLSDMSDLPNNRALVDALKQVVDRTGLVLSQIAMPARFWAPEGDDTPAPGQGVQQVGEDGLEFQKQRVKDHIDLCAELGIGLLRHDVVPFTSFPGDDLPLFEEALPIVAAATKECAQYAATKGVKTSIENHGFFYQGSERVRRVIRAVDEPNFGTTLDIGNFLCTDEDPVVATRNNLHVANIVHFKDFYIRKDNPGGAYLTSRGGKFLRGAVVGQGDIDMPAVAKEVLDFGWDGFVSIEFEGAEPALKGCQWGLENTRRLLGLN